MPPDYVRIYARQEYLTPGAAETVDLIGDAAHPTGASVLLEVACGKGEAACSLAEVYGCRVVAVDRFQPFLRHTLNKARTRGLHRVVQLARGDARELPFPAGCFDAAYCIGGPSLAGMEACLRELRRAVKPGGAVLVSDVVWRAGQDQSSSSEWDSIAGTARLTAADYRAVLERCGLAVERTLLHDRAAWDDYHAPMVTVADSALAAGDVAFADEIMRGIELERRAADTVMDYASFVTRAMPLPGEAPP